MPNRNGMANRAASPRGKPLRRQPAAPDLMRRMAGLAQVPLAPECQKYPPAAQHFNEKLDVGLTALAVTVVTAN
jgi:hypothetical protein